jgi:hypothetical protein
MNWKIWLNLIAVCGLCLLMPAALTAQQNKVTDSKATTSKQIVQARALGQVTVISGPTACNGETCYEIEVVCPQVTESERLMLRVVNPSTQVLSRGTIMFMSGVAEQAHGIAARNLAAFSANCVPPVFAR